MIYFLSFIATGRSVEIIELLFSAEDNPVKVITTLCVLNTLMEVNTFFLLYLLNPRRTIFFLLDIII